MNYKIIVNKDRMYDKKDFSNIKLVKITNGVKEECLLEKRTLKAFLDLKRDLEKMGIFISFCSGYRSVEEQEKLIDEFTSIYGSAYVKEYVAKPKTSEHHTGLCFDIDLIIDNKIVADNDELFANLDIFEKIISILPNYGLILRYPKGKEEITGYSYEPWHYRYVGKSTAKIITDNNLTLEEYDKLYNKSGILLVNKPKGLTSRDVVNEVGRI